MQKNKINSKFKTSISIGYFLQLYKHEIKYSFLLSAFVIFLSFSFTSCKKSKESEVSKASGEELPVFGNCDSVIAKGHLYYSNPNGPYTFRTGGGGTIIIDPASGITIMHDDYAGFNLNFWGTAVVNGQTKTAANHESLNGKRIKDRINDRRTIIFPDGAKITLVATGSTAPLTSVTIYDDAECHHINPVCSVLEYSDSSASITKRLDDSEPDGEAGTFEFTVTGLLFVNVYSETSVGNKVFNRVPLGEIYRAYPNVVDDYYP